LKYHKCTFVFHCASENRISVTFAIHFDAGSFHKSAAYFKDARLSLAKYWSCSLYFVCIDAEAKRHRRTRRSCVYVIIYTAGALGIRRTEQIHRRYTPTGYDPMDMHANFVMRIIRESRTGMCYYKLLRTIQMSSHKRKNITKLCDDNGKYINEFILLDRHNINFIQA